VQLIAGGKNSRRSMWAAWLNLERTPFILYSLGFAAFTLVDFDFCPDLIPFLPVVAIGSGWLVWQIMTALGGLWRRYDKVDMTQTVQAGLLIISALLIGGIGLSDAWGYTLQGSSLSDQMNIAQTALRFLGPDDRVLQFGDSVILIFDHRTNASKVLLLKQKSGYGLLSTEPGQIQALVDSLDRNPPKLIALSRESHPAWTRAFYEWLNQKYRFVEKYGWGTGVGGGVIEGRIFVRKP
jgi:hypothetical protein